MNTGNGQSGPILRYLLLAALTLIPAFADSMVVGSGPRLTPGVGLARASVQLAPVENISDSFSATIDLRRPLRSGGNLSRRVAVSTALGTHVGFLVVGVPEPSALATWAVMLFAVAFVTRFLRRRIGLAACRQVR